MDGRREVSIISHRPVTSSDLKQERSRFRRSVLSFSLQLVVALKQEHQRKETLGYKLVPRVLSYPYVEKFLVTRLA